MSRAALLAGGPMAAALALMTACGGGGSAAPASGWTPVPLRIEVQDPGLVRVEYTDLQAAGFTAGPVGAATLALASQGRPVALQVACAGGRDLAPGDSLEFYAAAVDTQYTGTNVFWLSTGTASPMATRPGAPAGAAPLTVFQDTLHMEQDKVLWGLTPGAPAADAWFWQILSAPATQAYAFQLPQLAEASGGSALDLVLCGKTASSGVSPDHHVLVSVNGVQVASLLWDGQSFKTAAIPLAPGLLAPGANTLTLDLPGDTGALVDQVLLKSFDLRFWTPLQAAAGQLTFTIPAGNTAPVQVAGFPGPDTVLLDITDPASAAFITPASAQDGDGSYHIRFLDPSPAARTYFASSPALVHAPSGIAAWLPGLLEDTGNGADYILITPRAFLPAVLPLCQLRQSQGLRVKAVAVEDIYNEFGYGFPVPDAIRSFLDYASRNWARPAPACVLLLGDATADYRDRMGTGKLSQVPCHLSATAQLGLTPDDNWYVALDGADELPSLQIGRLPSASAAQAAQLVQKLVQYETAPGPGPASALFVADDADPSFQAECDTLAGLLPSGMSARKVYMSQYTDYTQCTRDIVSALDSGMLLTTFNGHGDVTDWSGARIFNAGDLPLLGNAGDPTFMLALNCENAWFGMIGGYSLAESAVAAQTGGAIAFFGCSGLDYEWEDSLLAGQFFSQFFSGASIGSICTSAKVLAWRQGASADLLRTFTLIGDPAQHLRMQP